MPRPMTKTLKCRACHAEICNCERCHGTEAVCAMTTAEPIELTMNEDDEANRAPVSFPYFLVARPAPHHRSCSNADLEANAKEMAEGLGLENVKAKACKAPKCHAGPGLHAHVATRFPRHLAYDGLP